MPREFGRLCSICHTDYRCALPPGSAVFLITGMARISLKVRIVGRRSNHHFALALGHFRSARERAKSSARVSDVRTSTLVMVGFAVVFGLLAVFVAQAWLNRQAELRLRNIDPKPPAVATRTIVVAASPLRFGTKVTAQMLREVAWPEAAIPAGTFASINDVMAPGKRIVLAAIESNEPILRTKITGPGQRATLSAVIEPGMKAVTVRVNDVEGVGGFVLPGDHVDVLMTRQPDKANGMNDVVIQNARVLAVD